MTDFCLTLKSGQPMVVFEDNVVSTGTLVGIFIYLSAKNEKMTIYAGIYIHANDVSYFFVGLGNSF